MTKSAERVPFNEDFTSLPSTAAERFCDAAAVSVVAWLGRCQSEHSRTSVEYLSAEPKQSSIAASSRINDKCIPVIQRRRTKETDKIARSRLRYDQPEFVECTSGSFSVSLSTLQSFVAGSLHRARLREGIHATLRSCFVVPLVPTRLASQLQIGS